MSLPSKHYKLSCAIYCVGCRREVNPSLCRTGRVLQNIGFITQTKSHLVRVDPKIEYAIEEKRVPSVKYQRGLICSKCETNYGHIRGHQIVITDPLAGYNDTIQGHSIRADSFGIKQAAPLRGGGGHKGPEDRKCGHCGRRRDLHGVNGECVRKGGQR